MARPPAAEVAVDWLQHATGPPPHSLITAVGRPLGLSLATGRAAILCPNCARDAHSLHFIAEMRPGVPAPPPDFVVYLTAFLINYDAVWYRWWQLQKKVVPMYFKPKYRYDYQVLCRRCRPGLPLASFRI